MTSYVRGSGVGPMPTAGIWCGRPSGLDIGRVFERVVDKVAPPVLVKSLAALNA